MPQDDGSMAVARLADVLLQRAALVARVARDRHPDPLAGLKVDEEDVQHLLEELPGLEAPQHQAVAEIEALLATDVTAVRQEFAAAMGGTSPLAGVVRRARLSAVEAEVLAVLVAVERDPRRQRLVGYLNDDVTQRRLTPWTLQQLWDAGDPHLLAAGPGSGIRRAAFLEPPVDGPWASSPITLVDDVLWWLGGARFADRSLPPGSELVAGRDPKANDETTEPTIVVAAGPDRLRRLQAAVAGVERARCLITPVPAHSDEWDAVIRQATLDGLGVVLEIEGTLSPEARDRVDRADHLSWGLTSPEEQPLSALPRRPWREAEVQTPLASPAEWEATFGAGVSPSHRLSAEQLYLAGTAARALGGDIPAAVRRLAAGHIDSSAERIRPTRSWDDLVLDADRQEQVREIAVRCRYRDVVYDDWGFAAVPSVGVVALFAGPSGTGKTLAAEVIAAEIGVDLYKVDLANMVSKYIGETEKNLSRVFDAAEASNVALFFDEADALLGKRSAVSDAHDRYANIEVAYLLQRLERYQGLAVMATNLINNIDPAFVRRLHVVVEFPMPGPAERRRIWARCLPKSAPVGEDLDLDSLADRFELSGGTIRNAMLGAAFLAADAGTPITMEIAVAGLRRELEKSGRLVTAADFGHLAQYGTQ